MAIETADRALAASFQASRSPVVARGGMVATGHPLATAAGLDALRLGGNAMDAAIAAALTTAVVLPAMCGLGGDAFFIHADGQTGDVTALNGSGIAPRALSRDYFVSRGYAKMPFYGPLSMGVPGAVDAFFVAIERWCKLTPDSSSPTRSTTPNMASRSRNRDRARSPPRRLSWRRTRPPPRSICATASRSRRANRS